MLLTCNLPRRRGRTGRAPGQAFLRWLTALVAVSAVALLPWTAHLALTLPSSISARHWSLVWSGLDSATAAGLAATAVLAIRRDQRVALVAVSTATLLLADAWFDVCTSPPGKPLAWAVVDMGIEAVEAAACLVLIAAVWRHRQDSRYRNDGDDGCDRSHGHARGNR